MRCCRQQGRQSVSYVSNRKRTPILLNWCDARLFVPILDVVNSIYAIDLINGSVQLLVERKIGKKHTLDMIVMVSLERWCIVYNRPVSLPSATTKVLTAHGSLYVTITNDNGKLVEVFAHLGKAGSCDSAYIAAITRLASIALQYGVPIEVITKQLRAISCHPFMVGSDTENTSPVDAIGHVLEGGYNASSNK